jgi:hypothetical protein
MEPSMREPRATPLRARLGTTPAGFDFGDFTFDDPCRVAAGAVVPEPGALLLLATGLALVAGRGFGRRARVRRSPPTRGDTQ